MGKEEYPEAARLLGKHLDDNWLDPEALFHLGVCFMQTENTGLAYHCFKASGEIFGGEPAVWHNIGKLHHEKQRESEAEECFFKALKIKPAFALALEGVAMTRLNEGDPAAAISYANRALVENPDACEARTNRGMAYLFQKRWAEGWRDYKGNVNRDKNRKLFDYNGAEVWDGSPGKDLVITCEQGIGDEISFASCIPDVMKISKSVTIECDGRLEKLFTRSFPPCKVHGTRYKKTIPKWRGEGPWDAKTTISQLPEYFRNKDSDFPGTPYLVPDPEKAIQWKALLESLGKKPKIGLTWTGGIPHTGQKRRSITLDTYEPLFKAVDAEWISLQYKEHEVKEAEEKYGIKIHDWEWGTRVFDYDQTVALISQLDLVISVCTTVVHVAGGVGTECWTLVPTKPMWRYMLEGEWFPWANSVKLYRQKGKEWPTHLLAAKLREKFPGFAK